MFLQWRQVLVSNIFLIFAAILGEMIQFYYTIRFRWVENHQLDGYLYGACLTFVVSTWEAFLGWFEMLEVRSGGFGEFMN